MDYATQWLDYLRAEKRYSPLTVRAYGDDLRFFAEYIMASDVVFDPLQITYTDLRGYVMMMVERGDSARSVNRHIASIKSFFKYLMRLGVVQKNPTQKLHSLKTASRLPQFVPDNKLQEIMAQATEPHEDDITEQRDSMIILLLCTTGIRRAELAALTVGSIDLSNSKIRVMGKSGKERDIPLRHEVREKMERFLQKICLNQNNSLFLTEQNKPLTTADIYNIVRKKLMQAGVNGKRSPHVLRHTFATQLLNEGAPLRSIQELLGHASISSTQIYTHNTVEHLKESYIKAHPRAKIKS